MEVLRRNSTGAPSDPNSMNSARLGAPTPYTAFAKAVLRSLAQHGHAAVQIGTAEPGLGVCDADGRPLAWPIRDEVARLLSGEAEGPG